MTELWELESEIYAEGFSLICGVDEAGRGPLAGPVYAAAVILPRDIVIDGLNDSKKLTEKKREALFDVITERALTYGIASASVKEIEELNILNATFLAMNRAIEKLDPVPELALIDGNRNTGIAMPSRCVVKGDTHDAKIMRREIMRLEASLKAAGDKKKLVFLHYPPLFQSYRCEEILELLKSYEVRLCCYGHIHGKGCAYAFNGWRDGTEFRLVSADFVDFTPVKLPY